MFWLDYQVLVRLAIRNSKNNIQIHKHLMMRTGPHYFHHLKLWHVLRKATRFSFLSLRPRGIDNFSLTWFFYISDHNSLCTPYDCSQSDWEWAKRWNSRGIGQIVLLAGASWCKSSSLLLWWGEQVWKPRWIRGKRAKIRPDIRLSSSLSIFLNFHVRSFHDW